jgi:hypothetical protein
MGNGDDIVRYLLAILLLALAGCQSPQPPCASAFREIVSRPYTSTFDCSNKAGQYARALHAQGIDAWVVIVQPRGRTDLHALVLTGKLICDPTSGAVRENGDDFGYLWTVVRRETLYKDEEFR